MPDSDPSGCAYGSPSVSPVESTHSLQAVRGRRSGNITTVATAGYRHSQAPRSCRCATFTIAAMCSCQSLCLVATTHHRLPLFVAFVGSASGHGMLPCPSTTKLSPGVPASCGHRTLRQHASLLHNATLHKVHASQSQSSFGGHAPLARPVGFTQQALCKVAYAGSGRQLSALPGRYAPYAPPPVALWVCLHGGFGQALCAVLSVSGFAVSLGVGPRPPLALACCASIACAVCPSAPQGGSLRTAQKSTHIFHFAVEPCATSKTMQKSSLPPPFGGWRAASVTGIRSALRNRAKIK